MSTQDTAAFLASLHPWDALPQEDIAALAEAAEARDMPAGAQVYALGLPLDGLFVVQTGQIEIRDGNGAAVSLLGPRNSFGERGLMKDGIAVTSAHALAPSSLLVIPAGTFLQAVERHDPVRRFFDRAPARPRRAGLATAQVSALMAADPKTCAPETSLGEAARIMDGARISSLCVTGPEGALQGIVTLRDFTAAYARGTGADTPVAQIMTAQPFHLPPSAIGSDVLHAMAERRIGHVPIVQAGALVGMVTQTDLTRFQALSSAELVRRIAEAGSAQEMARATAGIPELLAQLVAGGTRHEIVTRLITDVADTATRRLLALAHEALGPAPVPYLWLACGSQGRQEQTGVSDQDNCLILSDDFTEEHRPWFHGLARFVTEGLNAAGYVFCPGDMMASNPRWCQPLSVWRSYFEGWIAAPGPEAQMLASVMFDLRPIGGETALWTGLQEETLARAAQNSIFVSHMIANSLGHTPPLGLFRGFATLRSGEHRNHIDLKHNGVVPVVDLGRIYALQARIPEAGTRPRLEAAQAAGVLSVSGGRDLLDAYDLIAQTRLEHQTRQIRAGGKPDNFMAPSDLSEFERSHLRDAFVVVKTMQSALGHGRGALG